MSTPEVSSTNQPSSVSYWPPSFQSTAWVEQVIGDVSVPALQAFNAAIQPPPHGPAPIKWRPTAPGSLVAGFYHPADLAELPGSGSTYASAQTLNQSGANFQVHASDKGHSFEGPNGNLILLFGDVFYTGGGTSVTALRGPFDVMAHSRSLAPPLVLTAPGGGFVETQSQAQAAQFNSKTNNSGNYTLLLHPGAPYSLQDMGGTCAPYSGITIAGQMFVCFRLNDANNNSTSVLSMVTVSTHAAAQNDPATAFSFVRVIDQSSTGGQFIQTALCPYTVQPGDPPGLVAGDYVLIFGAGKIGGSEVYLSAVLATEFHLPTATIYYLKRTPAAGVYWEPGQGNLHPLTSVGNVFDFSVAQVSAGPAFGYRGPPQPWVLLFDNDKGQTLVQFSDAPWGDWSAPQLLLSQHDCWANGAATQGAAGGQAFVLDASLVGTSAIIAPDTKGLPVGPNSQSKLVPYGPMLVQRFCTTITNIEGTPWVNTLRLFYTMTAGCPYYCYLMQADFLLSVMQPPKPPLPPKI